MDVMDEELLEFWRTLNEYQVKFMMIGGLATRFYGYNRTTDDLDMWIKDSVENRRNLRKAFAALAYGDFPEIEAMQLARVDKLSCSRNSFRYYN